MSEGCCGGAPKFDGSSPAYRRVLWTVMTLNATMFVVEVAAGYLGRSQALQADALDFLGDAATYGLTLFVVGRPPVWRAGAALVKSASLAALALWVLASTAWRIVHGADPQPLTMGLVGALALAVNVGAALLLFRFRDGDANVRSVWLCSRNDAIGNVAVLIAAAAVAAGAGAWPDLAVAVAMSALFLSSSIGISQQAAAELRTARAAASRLGSAGAE